MTWPSLHWRMPVLPRLLLAVALGAALAGCNTSTAPDTIFVGGPVLTVNANDEVAQALAVRGGIITAVEIGRAHV